MKLFNFLILSIVLIISACEFGLGPYDKPYDDCRDYIPFYQETDTNSSYLYVACDCQDSMIDLATELASYDSVQNLRFTCNDSRFDAIPLMPSVKELESTVITSNITAFPNLETFISTMETPFVSELTLLPNLRKIEVDNLFEFPDEIGTIPLEEFNITYRRLGNNKNDAIPSNLHKLTNLTSLEIHWNYTFVIPDNYSNLTSLQRLVICTSIDNDLELSEGIPDVFENLDSLIDIRLWRTPISTNSQKNLYKTPNLKVLNFDECSITEITSEIGNLTTLEKLSIRSKGTRLSILPQSISNLSNLKELRFTSPNFTQIPNSIIGLKNNLERLQISASPLTSVFADIGDFTHLKHLTLYDCQLTSLPSEIQNISNTLIILDLRKNTFDEATKQQIKNWLPKTRIYF